MMITTFVSDLHLGDGGPLEDFLLWGAETAGPPAGAREEAREALGRSFAAFLRERLREAEASGFQPHLVLAGDTFDLWQARRDRESNAAALGRILAAHPAWLGALRAWSDAGGLVTLLIGNHDHALVDPATWDVLRRAIPLINPTADGAPLHALADEAAGWYAEHGNQWDPINRLRSLTNPGATCAGYRIVRAVVNNLEPMIPALDKGLDLQGLAEELWRAGQEEISGLWKETARHLARLVGRGAGPARELGNEVAEALERRKERPDFRRVGQSQRRVRARAIRRALSPLPGGTIAPPPRQWRFLVSGHTHRHGTCRRPGPGGEVLHLDCGTWTPRLYRGDDGTRRMLQPLPYAQVAPDPHAGHVAGVGQWRGGGGAQAL